MFIIGIDPGNKGGVAQLITTPSVGYTIDVYPIPTMKEIINKKNRIKIDTLTLTELVRGADLISLEKSSPMPGEGSIGMFNYGKGYGIILGIAAALSIDVLEVHPATWKKHMLGKRPKGTDTKNHAITKIKELYPKIKLLATKRSKKEHDGMAEAALIAIYGAQIRYNFEEW